MIKEKQMNKNKKLANMAMLVALAMIFSYVESLIPINFGIPGMKLGVANLVTVTGLYFLELPEVFLVVVMRILLTGFLFGNGMSIIYNLKLSGYGIDEEAERIFHSRSQYRWRRVAQYRSDHRGISCGRESETDLLSAGTSDRRYSDRIRDGNYK